MKETALAEVHQELGAKMVSFAGCDMPMQYEGVNVEHVTVRSSVGVFDVSHMGEFLLRGDKALDLIQKVTTNDASKLEDGKVQYSCMPNDRGGIVDDLLVYRIKADEYMLVVNAANIDKDWSWIQRHNTFDVGMTNISNDISLLAVQGPKSVEALQSLTDVDLKSMVYYTFEKGTFAGIDDTILSATGYTGSGGFEIYVKNRDAKRAWEAIFNAGKCCGIKPIGLAARDTLRLEMGYCLYGNDIDDSTSPMEAGLGWITKFSKKFINSDAIEKQKKEGVSRKLVAFEMIDRAIPRQNYKIVDMDGQVIGKVTSGTMSPSLKKGIGLGYVRINKSKVDTEIFIQIRNKNVEAKVVKLPFYK